MASDALCLMLYNMEEENKPIPEPSDPLKIKTNNNSFISLIYCDTIEYRKFYDNKAVKKTLTIPSWLNTVAEKENVNFSLILQNGLKEHLNIEA